MRKLFVYLILVLFIPSIGLADVIVFQDGTQIETKVIQESDSEARLYYEGSSLTYLKNPIEGLQLNPPVKKDTLVVPFLESIAEASVELPEVAIRAYLEAHQRIQNSWQLKDLETSLSDQYLDRLSKRVDAGANSLVVLQMIKNLSPENVEVLDTHIEEEKAQIAVRGQASLGDMYGIVTMVKEKAQWRVDQESWFSADLKDLKQRLPLIAVDTVKSLDLVQARKKKESLTASLRSPDYSFDYNPFSLKKLNPYERDEAFMLVFFVQKGESRAKDLGLESSDESDRNRIHVLWTGPKQLVPKPKMYEDQYSWDVSIANDDDGYLSGNFNLKLPDKRPKEVAASFLLNF